MFVVKKKLKKNELIVYAKQYVFIEATREQIENTKAIIRIRKSKKDRQYIGHKKKNWIFKYFYLKKQ